MAQKTISAAEAKRRFSEILGRVRYGGESFVVSRRGRPVARIGPVEAPSGATLADVEGWLDEDDPFFTAIDEIVATRSRRLPRAVRPPRRRRQ